MKKLKQEKAITLIALVITIIVLLILAGVSIATLTGENGILSQATKAGEKTKMADAQEQVELAVLASYDNKGNIDIEEKLNENLSKIEGLTYRGGKIEDENEIKKLADIVNVNGYDIYIQEDGTTNPVSKDVKTTNKEIPNEPVILSGMTKIMFTEPTEEAKGEVIKAGEEGFKEDNWYNYTEKRWANVETKDESMWVWIPRFAYKITSQPIWGENGITSGGGTIDVKFLIGTTDYYYDENGKMKTAKRASDLKDGEIADTTTDYYVHPAFTDESNLKVKYENGGWREELTGIWVAKFEAGYPKRK